MVTQTRLFVSPPKQITEIHFDVKIKMAIHTPGILFSKTYLQK